MLTQAQLLAEIQSQLPTNNVKAITAAVLRGVLDDMVSATFQGTGLGITRAQIPTMVVTAQTFATTGFHVPNDLGVGAIYTSIGATANGLMAIQDLAGTWFNLVIRDGNVNIGHLGAYGDGVTDDYANFQVVRGLVNRFGAGLPQVVTISIGSPAVVTYAPTTQFDVTKIRTNDVVVFSTTGQLPAGIVAGALYYVKSVGYANGSFQVSSVNNYGCDAEGAAIVTSGSQSGIHSAQILSLTWINTVLPPAAYALSNFTLLGGSQARNRTYAYGSVVYTLGFGSNGFLAQSPINAFSSNYALIQTCNSGDGGTYTITLVTPSDHVYFLPNHWICIAALDTQNDFNSQQSWPPNNHYVEFAKIRAIDPNTGIITLFAPLKQTYKSTYPIWWPGNRNTVGQAAGGGAATIYAMPGMWDAEHEYYGVNLSETLQQSISSGRKITFIDCSFSNEGPLPSGNQAWIAKNSVWGSGAAMVQGGHNIEFDKLVEYAEMTDCTADNITNVSSALQCSVFERCNIGGLTGAGRSTVIKDCTIGNLDPGISYGACDSILIENSYVGQLVFPGFGFLSSYRHDPFAYQAMVNNYGFSNGTLTIPMNADLHLHEWAVPGRKAFINDLEGLYQNCGAPFSVLDVRTDGTNLIVDTTLGTNPSTLGGSTNSVVTIDIASPAVVHWTSHGLAADTPIAFMTTGTLPAGISVQNVYYVLAAGLGASQFEFALTKGGTPIVTSGTQSGVQTCVAKPMHFEPHPCPRVTVRNCRGDYRLANMNGADEEPLYSRAKRVYVSQIGPQEGWHVNVESLWGNLVSFSLNVVRAYTGADATKTMTFTMDVFDGSLIRSTLTFVLNTKIAGLRVVTPAGVSGAQSGDSLSATGAWFSNGFKVETDNMFTSQIALNPIVEVEVLTDQGITKYQTLVTTTPNQAKPSPLVDTGMWGAVT